MALELLGSLSLLGSGNSSGGGGEGVVSLVNTIDTSLVVGADTFGAAQIEITFNAGEDLADQTVNGYDLTSTLDETYGFPFPGGKRALYSRQATRIDEVAGPGNSPNLQILGAMTINSLIYPNETRMPATPLYPGFGATGETEAANFPWSFRQDSTGRTEVFWEQGAGGNVETITEFSPIVGQWNLVTLTRASDGRTCLLYLNGKLMVSFTQSAAPTGGTSSEFICDKYMGWLGGFVISSGVQTPAFVAGLAAQVGVFAEAA